MPEYQTTESLAEQLHVTPKAIREWYKRGDLAGYRLGRRLLFATADVVAFVETRRNVQQPKPRHVSDSQQGQK